RLKDFRVYLQDRKPSVSGDPWVDCVDYFQELFNQLDQNDLKPYLHGCHLILAGMKPNSRPFLEVQERIEQMELRTKLIRNMFGGARANWTNFYQIARFPQIDQVDCRQSPVKIDCQAFTDQANRIDRFQFEWGDLWRDMSTQVRNERASFKTNHASLI